MCTAAIRSQPRVPLVVQDVAVPVDLVADAAGFGGQHRADCLVGDLHIEDGAVVGLKPPTERAASAERGARMIEGRGRLVLPRLVEAHCHLDKCHTVDRLPPVGGDLMAAIEAQADDKEYWTEDDIRQRAARGLAELVQAGCGVVRSHVDWGSDGAEAPVAWEVMTGLAQDWRDRVHLQPCPLVGLDVFADLPTAEAIARRVSADGGALGVFVLHHEDKRPKLDSVFALADRFGLPLDFHVDETLAENQDGLETVADAALAANFQGPVLCGHALSLATREGAALDRLIDKIARAGLSVAALPTTNLYLQDRRTGSPLKRGMTRLRELAAAGVRIVVGTDNVRDAFCPTGRHDPLYALAHAVLIGHLDPPLGRWLRCVVTDAAAAIGISATTVDHAKIENLLICAAEFPSELLSGAYSPPKLLAEAVASEGWSEAS